MVCASCERSWVECQHFSGGEPWPYVLPHSFTPISLSSCCRAHSLSICDLTGQSLILFAAACLFPWWTPLPPGHSIQPTIVHVKWWNHSRCGCCVPSLPCPALLQLLWGSLGRFRALLDHFLPVFPQKLTADIYISNTTAALFFTLRSVCLTPAFCSHCHSLLPHPCQHGPALGPFWVYFGA